MVDARLALGAVTALVQGGGVTRRVGAAQFRAEPFRSEAPRRSMNRCIHVLMSQLAASAVCMRFHEIGP